ncbi:carbohydrate kinase [Spirochaetia bacterium]|nr:carbohydrate kinase [Spirochaetia bacterium]
MARYILGIDAGTESIRTGIYDETGTCLSFGVGENKNIHRHPGWGEQSLEQWERALAASIKQALAKANIDPGDIKGIGLDGTSCTVVMLDKNGKPLRDAIMWMDIRAAAEAREIAASGDPALKYVGFGNVSAEWFPCKVLWVKRHEPEIYKAAATIFEHSDWLVYRLTGEVTGNINATTIRWFYNFREGGRPVSLYNKIGLDDIEEKLPRRIMKLGEVVAGLTKEMADLTGLKEGIPIAGGGVDAYMGVIGVNALRPGQLALITGSSQLHIGLSDVELHAKGLFGSFPDAIVPGAQVVEAGQISTGSIIKWFTTNFISADIKQAAEARKVSLYQFMDEEAAKLPAGSEGLVVLEHWQGNRTPWVDPSSRGVIRGLTLKHGPAHIWRAIMEGVVYGTQVILKKMEENFTIDEIITCGGAAQSELWMQIHADVTGKPFHIPEDQNAVCLGAGILGSVGAGFYPDILTAAAAMVRKSRTILPNPEQHARYREYVYQYEATYNSLKDDSRRLVGTLQ